MGRPPQPLKFVHQGFCSGDKLSGGSNPAHQHLRSRGQLGRRRGTDRTGRAPRRRAGGFAGKLRLHGPGRPAAGPGADAGRTQREIHCHHGPPLPGGPAGRGLSRPGRGRPDLQPGRPGQQGRPTAGPLRQDPPLRCGPARRQHLPGIGHGATRFQPAAGGGDPRPLQGGSIHLLRRALS